MREGEAGIAPHALVAPAERVRQAAGEPLDRAQIQERVRVARRESLSLHEQGARLVIVPARERGVARVRPRAGVRRRLPGGVEPERVVVAPDFRPRMRRPAEAAGHDANDRGERRHPARGRDERHGMPEAE